ncbi:OmpA family protein [Solidesulfovibrio carbinolicus]|uniref:Flagellar motor protein MotB n=1 Tax=Solidesulfovibrio carbinolicus TaxID=296842 RepID=A0A4P6HPA4_9BACT|nr:OmpA family protein [Solidesulfovibrio carbinolicus]QAZ69117.1 flagellar motor protein MotB [Solidesulfovibrio carbinolicus]
MRGRLLKIFMVILVLVPVGLTAYLANSLYHRKGVPQALENLTRQLFQSKEEEKKAEKRAQDLERKTEELQTAYDALVADLRGEVDSRQIRVRQFREKLEINFVDKILFPSGSAEISPKGRDILTRVGAVLAKVKDKSIYVVGHTDNVPIHSSLYASNWELSASRAASVIRHLSEAGGLAPERFTAMGRAFYQPVASNATPEGRQENRRVDIIVADVPLLAGETGSQSMRGTVSGGAAGAAGTPGTPGTGGTAVAPDAGATPSGPDSGTAAESATPEAAPAAEGAAPDASKPLRETAPPAGQTLAPPEPADRTPASPQDQAKAAAQDAAAKAEAAPAKDDGQAASSEAASTKSEDAKTAPEAAPSAAGPAGPAATPDPSAGQAPDLPPPLPDKPAPAGPSGS